MFRDVHDLLFTQDGVFPDLVRPGEPRLSAPEEAEPARAAGDAWVPLRHWVTHLAS